jgi:DUF971 family protein
MRENEVEILDGGEGLALASADGRRRVLDAALLWAECPSAQGRVRRMRGQHLSPPRGLAIRSVSEIGNYGLNITFSDGHDRGIYPWPYLASLAAKPKLEDFLSD